MPDRDDDQHQRRLADRRDDHAYHRINGICIACRSAAAAQGHARCPSCLERAAMIERRAAVKAKNKGQCVSCRREPPRPNRTLCASCAKRNSRNGRTLRRVRTANGLCSNCGKVEVRHGVKTCAKCRKITGAATARIVAERRTEGTCPRCGDPLAPDRAQCGKCLRRYAKYMRERRALAKGRRD